LKFEYLSKIYLENAFHYNLTRITGTFQACKYTFLITPRSYILRMGNVSDKTYGENQNTRFMINNFFFPENLAVYEIMLIRIVELRETTDDNMARAHCVLDT